MAMVNLKESGIQCFKASFPIFGIKLTPVDLKTCKKEIKKTKISLE